MNRSSSCRKVLRASAFLVCSLLFCAFVTAQAADDSSWGNYALKGFADIYYPQPVSWMPATSTWFLVLLPLLYFLSKKFLSAYRVWNKNAYRRSALERIERIALSIKKPGQNEIDALPSLLKAVALQSFSRPTVANLSTSDWLNFLAESSYSSSDKKLRHDGQRFLGSDGELLLRIAYEKESSSVEQRHLSELVDLSRRWIKHHDGSESRDD